MRFHAPAVTASIIATLAGLAGCTSTSDRAAEPVIWAGAMQDENYEIQGKPQAGGGETSGYGYDQQGGEMNAQALEQQAVTAPQVHYHIHHHYHYGTPAPVFTGYAHPAYSVQVHHAMPAYTSPYANNPNGGNPVGPQGYGPWNYHPGYGGWGSYNPWMNNGAGGLMPPPGE
jgi:hypothetical protein